LLDPGAGRDPFGKRNDASNMGRGLRRDHSHVARVDTSRGAAASKWTLPPIAPYHRTGKREGMTACGAAPTIVGRERVIASTDCDLGGRIHPQIAWAKLDALVQGGGIGDEAAVISKNIRERRCQGAARLGEFMSSITQAHCNTCGQLTNHDVIAERDNGPEDGSYIYEFEMLECRGCSSVSMRESVGEPEKELELTFYPPALARRAPEWVSPRPWVSGQR
jgi:hypothetical protein